MSEELSCSPKKGTYTNRRVSRLLAVAVLMWGVFPTTGFSQEVKAEYSAKNIINAGPQIGLMLFFAEGSVTTFPSQPSINAGVSYERKVSDFISIGVFPSLFISPSPGSLAFGLTTGITYYPDSDESFLGGFYISPRASVFCVPLHMALLGAQISSGYQLIFLSRLVLRMGVEITWYPWELYNMYGYAIRRYSLFFAFIGFSVGFAF